MVTRVLILDSYSSDNRGDAAILTTMMDSLREILGEVEFTVHSSYPSVTTETHHVTAGYPLFESQCLHGSYERTYRALNDKRYGSIHREVVRKAARLAFRVWVRVVLVLKMVAALSLAVLFRLRCDLSQWSPVRRWRAWVDYCQADLVWGMGGTFYNDNYGSSLPGRLLNLLYGKSLNKPVGISSHSFGPFRRPFYRRMARFVFDRVDLLCCRSDQDFALLSDLGVYKPRIEVTADSAWLLQPASPSRARQILLAEGAPWPEGKPHLSMSAVRSWLYRDADPAAAHRRYVAALAEALDRLVLERDVSIYFLSTCRGGTVVDDLAVAEEIRANMRRPDRLTIVRGSYTAGELQGLYGLMDLHIGTRMHSNILAASMGVPLVGIAYEAKTIGLMEDLGLSEYCVNISAIDAEKLVRMVLVGLDQQERLKLALLERVPVLRTRARKNAQYMAELLALSAQKMNP